MIIEKLRLKGFTGIQKGLGLDEIEIDFKGISGLVAFDGANGAGKSTVLENLGAYNQLASREGALFRHVFLRDSEKELSFSYQGHNYKTLLKIDCDSEKSEGYIWLDGDPVVNGKISQYAKYMKDLFGSPELFYNSVFCSQNAKKLSDMRTGELKGLFSEFLRLDRYVKFEDTAKQCANIIAGKAGQIETRIAGLKEKLSGIDQARAEIETQEREHLSLVADLDCGKAELKDYQKRADNLKYQIAANTVAEQRRADIKANIGRLQKELEAEKSGAEAEIDALKVKYREVSAELVKFDAVIQLGDAIREAGNTTARLEKQIAEVAVEIERLADEIAKSQTEIHRLESELQIKRQAVRDLDNDVALRTIDGLIFETQNKITEKTSALIGLKSDRKSFEIGLKIDQYKESIKKLAFRDARCPEGENSCLYIKDALAARDALPGAELEYEERKAAIAKESAAIQIGIDALNAENKKSTEGRERRIAEIKEQKDLEAVEIHRAERAIKAEKVLYLTYSDELQTLKLIVHTAKNELATSKTLSERKAELQIALSKKADIADRLIEITETGKGMKATWEQKEKVRMVQIQELVVKQAEIDKEINHGVETELAIAKSNIDDAEKRIPILEEKIQDVRSLISVLNGDLARMLDAEKELDEIQGQKDLLVRNASEWTYLRNACSKNGLQALEIDGSAPLITSFANDLLSKSFGTMYSVRLLTQDAEGKEALDIMVIDENGSEDLLENKSGGEKVFCLQALRLAMTLLSTEKSGRLFETAFSDESDGALDADNALNYVALYRSFMEVGGFKNFFFISHRAACRNQADHVLTFERGKNPYWR